MMALSFFFLTTCWKAGFYDFGQCDKMRLCKMGTEDCILINMMPKYFSLPNIYFIDIWQCFFLILTGYFQNIYEFEVRKM